MTAKYKRLSALKVSRLIANEKSGLYPDGGGLYLQKKPQGGASWVFRYKMGGRTTSRDMGLGSAIAVSLSRARTSADEARNLIAAGADPIENRRAQRAAETLEAAKSISFRDCAEKYIAAHKAGWRNAKHAGQWTFTLETYVYPAFGSLSVASVDTGLVLKVIEPIWTTKTETASRVRGRIESILDWAKVRGYRTGENSARWRGHLDKLLPARNKVRKVKHHEALPYAEIGAFMESLREHQSIIAKAIEWLILTATRSDETTSARWDEIDFQAKAWVIPGLRMKTGLKHRIPLSSPALKILRTLLKQETGEYIFPGKRVGRPLSASTLLVFLKRMGQSDLTVHGFRTTFRDWTAEQTNYPREVAEMALTHTVSDNVEAAYRRGDLFDKRKRLMTDWGKYCGIPSTPEEVVPIRGAKKRRG